MTAMTVSMMRRILFNVSSKSMFIYSNNTGLKKLPSEIYCKGE
jgi:hypothetical protein